MTEPENSKTVDGERGRKRQRLEKVREIKMKYEGEHQEIKKKKRLRKLKGIEQREER